MELIVGGSGANDTEAFPAVLNNILGTKFKIITGYSGTGITLAMERGEVFGRCGWSWTSFKSQRGQWLRDKKVNILIQLSLRKLPEIGDVPLVTELATGKDQAVLELSFARQTLGRPFMMAPGVPADRVKAIRTAFNKSAADKDLIAELKKMKFDVSPVSGTDMQKVVAKMYRTPKAIVDRARDAIIYKGRKIKAKIKMVKHTGKVTVTKRGGRRIIIMYKGKEVTAKVSGRRTKVTIDGKKTKRKNIKVGMTCTFNYPGSGQQAKNIDCKS